MLKAAEIFEKLWEDYSHLNPQAEKIHALLGQRGENLVNDHVAFRTFDFMGALNEPLKIKGWTENSLGIAEMAAPFMQSGYQPVGNYLFPEKKLIAIHYEHSDTNFPKVFISALKVRELSEKSQKILCDLLLQVPLDFASQELWCLGGRPWDFEYATYTSLEKESEYAAWMSAFGFRANHFTVSVNALKTFSDLAVLNEFLLNQGFKLNAQGGLIKGSPAEFLEQSSTMAESVEILFQGEKYSVPACYYEFALRYPMPDGKLFQGFIANSANKIFESTDRKLN